MIYIKNISKIKNKKSILDDVSLNIEGIYGLIGPNGAGKTTLMRAIAGIISVDNGTIDLEHSDDLSIKPKKIKDIRNLIGYLPQDFNLYPKATVQDCLNHIAILKGLKNSDERAKRINYVLKKVNLLESKTKKVGNLSGGMRKRLGIAQLFLTDPQIIIVDEPTSGLDIYERIRFRNLLKELSREKTVIISSHIVEDIEFLCTKVGIIKEGKLLVESTPQALASYAKGLVWEMKINHDSLNEILNKYMVIEVDEINIDTIKVKIISTENPGGAVAVNPRFVDGYVSIIKELGGEQFSEISN